MPPQERLAARVEVTDDEGPEVKARAPHPVAGADDEDDQPARKQKFRPAAPAADDQPARKPAPRPAKSADGSEFVEIKDDALKARFNRLYRTTKEAQERAEKTEKSLGLLAEQNKKLFDAIQKLTSSQKDRETRDEVTRLRAEAKDALATGDTDAFTQVNERLVEIKAEATAAKSKEADADDSDDRDDRDGDDRKPPITEAEFDILRRWQAAKSEEGEHIRPWAIPGHEEFATTQDMIRRVSARDDMADASVREILAEVDKRMRKLLGADDEEPVRRRGAADDDQEDEDDGDAVRRAFSPPSGRAVGRDRRDANGELSRQEKAVAEQMFLGGRGAPAKNAKEAHELYRKQKLALSRVVAVED